MKTNNPIKTKDEFIQFAKAYNHFIIVFLINLFLGLPCSIFLVGIMNYSEGDLPMGILSILVPVVLILNLSTIVLMFIAAKKSKSDFCFISSVLYFVLTILVIYTPLAAFPAFIMLFVMLSSFYYAFKKYYLDVFFLVTQGMIESIWFCTCGSVCNSDFCFNCGQYWMNVANNNVANNNVTNDIVANNNVTNNNAANDNAANDNAANDIVTNNNAANDNAANDNVANDNVANDNVVSSNADSNDVQ